MFPYADVRMCNPSQAAFSSGDFNLQTLLEFETIANQMRSSQKVCFECFTKSIS